MLVSHPDGTATSWLYYPPPMVLFMAPQKGPAAGGTLVTLTGRYLLSLPLADTVLVKIDGTTIPGTQLPNGSIRCVTPMLRLGYSDVSVSTNGGVDFTHSAFYEATSPFAPVRFSESGAKIAPPHRRTFNIPNFTIAPSYGPVLGGTRIHALLKLPHHYASKTLFCRFGDAQTPAIVKSADHVVCVSPVFKMSICPVDCRDAASLPNCPSRCTHDGWTVTDVQIAIEVGAGAGAMALTLAVSTRTFTYDHMGIRLRRLSPSHGSTSGGTRLTVHGAGFLGRGFNGDLTCRFDGSVVVPATVISYDLLACRTPRPRLPGYVSLEVASAASPTTSSGLTFLYAPAVVTSASPLSGPMRGGTVLTIQGHDLSPWSLRCWTNGLELYAWFNSVEEVVCWLPPQSTMRHALVTLSSANVTLDGGAFFYHKRDVHVTALQPSRAPVSGGTIMTVFGEGFLVDHLVWCRFRDKAADIAEPSDTAARWMSSNLITCLTPSYAFEVGSSVVLEVSINAKEYTTDGQTFDLCDKVAISSMHPAQGPYQGGTRVAIQVYDAQQITHCRFNNSIVAATVTSRSRNIITCVAPTLLPGSVAVEVSGNQVDWSSDGHTFEYIGAYVTTESLAVGVLPDHGPTNGGTLVVFEAPRIGEVTDCLHVSFGGTLVDATARSSNVVTCLTPKQASAGQSAAQLYSHFAPLTPSTPFRFYANARIQRVHPAYGPVRGGTRMTVDGWGFGGSNSWMCVFGAGLAPARVLLDSRLECYAPALLLNNDTSAPSTVAFSITTNLVDFLSSAYSFTYVPVVTIRTMAPSKGPTAGGTSIIVSASNNWFSHNSPPHQLQCLFGSTEHAPATIFGRANIMLKCVSPPRAKVGEVAVSITTVHGDAASFVSQDDATFEYVNLVLQSASPQSGPTSGGTLVLLHGMNFIPSIWTVICEFGSGAARPAFVRSSSNVACYSPSSSRQRRVDLRLRVDGVTLPGSVTYTFYTDPVILSAYPLHGPRQGGTSIILRLNELPPTNAEPLLCKLGAAEPIIAHQMPAHTSSLVCITPVSSSEAASGVYDLKVSFNGQDYSPSVHYEFYLPLLIFEAIAPICGSISGGTELYIAAGRIPPRASAHGLIFCRFASVQVAGALEPNARGLRCTAPPAKAGYAAVEVSVNGPNGDYTSSGSLFKYEVKGMPSVQPTVGPIEGGTILTVAAGLTCGAVQCHFEIAGDPLDAQMIVQPASLVSSQIVYCQTPRFRTAALVTLKLSEGGILRFPPQYFRYAKLPGVTVIRPAMGPPAGGTRVEVHGRDFLPSNALYCVLGSDRSHWVAAEWITSQLIACILPAHVGSKWPTLTTPLCVTNDAVSFSEDTIRFTYRNTLIHSAEPSSGPMRGGTLVTLLGSGFGGRDGSVAFVQITCLFSGVLLTEQPGTVQSDGKVVCRTPPSLGYPRNTAIKVGVDGEHTDSSVTFEYHPPFELVALSPQQGPVRGGTLVVVEGSGFRKNVPVGKMATLCKFGFSTLIQATVLSSNSARCITPSASSEGAVQLEIGLALPSVNGSNFQSPEFARAKLNFVYVPIPVVSSISPTFGPQGGGTVVQFSGIGFRNAMVRSPAL